tara:strand:- start:320 stop:1369 length:1050 start_codon:yes stop_codon:yes gene_type:complete
MINKKVKFGIFGINSSSGLSLTTHKRRWKGDWKSIIKLVKYCDNNGIDFILPLSQLKDWGGKTRPNKFSMETFTFSSILGAITKKIYFYSTIHMPHIHPLYAAKATATIDNFIGKRHGVNLVCGYNPKIIRMFNAEQTERFGYDQAAEWVKIYKKLLSKRNDSVSFNGNFFKIKNAQCYPKSSIQPHPEIVSAAFSPSGRDFALNNCNVLFTMFKDFENTKKNNIELKKKAKRKKNNIKIYTALHIISRNSKNEALEFKEMLGTKYSDSNAVKNYLGATSNKLLNKLQKENIKNIATSCGAKVICGDYKNVSEELREVSKIYDGIAMIFLDYHKELAIINEKILKKIKS